ncbi:uncharacterized protein LOC141591269 [Silene latifolia]|uniref:uncharacterized protein LOC141591269 n=1 Tax=Silene latifolia TaxID=37657 RepID=UPI003D77D953
MEETQLDPFILATLNGAVNSLHNLLKPQLDPLILTARLYDATIRGDLNSLHGLLCEDPFILDRCIIQKSDRFMQSPLHVAVNLGHLQFTTEILRLKPDLAGQLVQSTRASALHLASEKGHLEIVKKLLEVIPNMCFSRDQDGRNPVHVAAIYNHLHVLEFLVSTNPSAAREITNSHETILHLCVKYAQFEPLKYSVNAMGELLNAKDINGNTVLHLAVVAKQLEAVKLLAKMKKMQQNAVNKSGLTALDCLAQNGRSPEDKEIRQTLKRAKALKAKAMEKQKNKDGKWLNKQRNTLMVVATVIATMAFQFGVNPDLKDKISDYGYKNLTIVNTISLVSSLSVVLVLIGGLPCKRLFVVVLIATMWVSLTSTIYTYFLYLAHPSNELPDDAILLALTVSSAVWIILLLALLLGHILRVLIKLVKKLVRKLWAYCCHGSLNSREIP